VRAQAIPYDHADRVVSSAEAWSFGTSARTPAGDYRGHGVRPELVAPRSYGGFSFGYSTGGFDSCSQSYGGFYSHCRYGFGPSTNYVPPRTYRYPRYAPGYNGYEDGYYRGYYDGNPEPLRPSPSEVQVAVADGPASA
jgi:hypothetical protein